jgi:hypothetical protein
MLTSRNLSLVLYVLTLPPFGVSAVILLAGVLGYKKLRGNNFRPDFRNR